MSQVIFTDPKLGTTYTWERNPSSEQPWGKTRTIERTSNTGNVGAVKQQGDDGPLILDWSIYVLDSSMWNALRDWYRLCDTQTIYLTDWDGDEYEGQIIALQKARNQASTEYLVCELQFEIYKILSGSMAGLRP